MLQCTPSQHNNNKKNFFKHNLKKSRLEIIDVVFCVGDVKKLF
jgi:hypothetical protein